MKTTTINILVTNRPHFFEVNCHFLNKIKDENKEKINLNILTNKDICDWGPYVKILTENGLDTNVINFSPGNNYMAKIGTAVNSSGKYCVSMDEDCFINNYVWDYMIENSHILDDPNNLVLSPMLSNGIPTTDKFVERFFTSEEIGKYNSILLNVTMPSMLWGVDYAYLNECTKNTIQWNSIEFYNLVSKLNHHYKGIHPIRISLEAHVYLHELLLKHKNEFLKNQNYGLFKMKAPYLCNNLYMIKTDTWKKILSDRSLFRDNYDEVPLNLYKERHNLDFVFVDNCFGIHVAYNCIPNHLSLENNFFNEFKEIIK